MARRTAARERLLEAMRTAAARGHAVELKTGTVKVGSQLRPAVRAICRCGWSSRWRHSKAQALSASAWHVGQVAGEPDPLWDPVLGVGQVGDDDSAGTRDDETAGDSPKIRKVPRSVGGRL